MTPLPQGTVGSFDPHSTSGVIVKDDGTIVPFTRDAFAASGLRLLRPGQRVKFRQDAGGRVKALTILTLPDPD